MKGLDPSLGTEAPLIARLKAIESKFRQGGRQVVAHRTAEFQKGSIHLDADDVLSRIVWSRLTASSAVEAREWVLGARL